MGHRTRLVILHFFTRTWKIRLSLKLFSFTHCLEQQIYFFKATNSASKFLKNCSYKESVCTNKIP